MPDDGIVPQNESPELERESSGDLPDDPPDVWAELDALNLERESAGDP